MQGRMAEAVLLQNELAQALGFVRVALVQAIGEEALGGFALEAAAQGNALIA